MVFCEGHYELHSKGYFLPISDSYNLTGLGPPSEFTSLVFVEDPTLDEWGYLETGPIYPQNWQQWYELVFLVRLGSDSSGDFPMRIELRWGDDLRSWEEASYQEFQLHEMATAPPWGGEGILLLATPSLDGVGHVLSFRLWLQDRGSEGTYFRVFDARWERFSIPDWDFFNTHDCGPNHPPP